MKATLKNAMEIEAKGGAILASEWTNGSGNYISKRPIPAHCSEIEIRPYGIDKTRLIEDLKGKTKTTARRLAKRHPKAQKLIAVTDRRGLLKAVREGGAK